MKDLESIYENMQNAFYATSSGHESEELKTVKAMLPHIHTLETIANRAYEKEYKKQLLNEIRFIKSYVDELINLHQGRL
jgi:hypothetical protein